MLTKVDERHRIDRLKIPRYGKYFCIEIKSLNQAEDCVLQELHKQKICSFKKCDILVFHPWDKSLAVRIPTLSSSPCSTTAGPIFRL